INFRCFRELSLDWPAGVIAVVGPNASGKTTLLEALFVASAGRSPRTGRDTELISWGAGYARVEVCFERDDGRGLRVVFHLEVGPSGPRKRLMADDKPVRRATDLVARVPLVLFVPADLQLAQASPGVRRRFLNLALARLGGAYPDDLARYSRALVQRNRLLAQAAPAAQRYPWEAAMAEAGAQVVAQRRAFVKRLSEVAAQIHAHLAGPAERLTVEYASQLDGDAPAEIAENYRAHLARLAADEERLGRTLTGPHRDDLRLMVNGRLLRRFGSQGQQRTAALALKLAEAELLRQSTGEAPILLLDDCLSELDQRRAKQVLGLTASYRQLIVTSAARDPALEQAEVAAWVSLGGGWVEANG
ncbi:MAG: DNA replication and repair protein RecF, partial [Armatimonadetes bacterium]|nr:DNA replication and repair protein RecF [Armatimonadota bacterium]